MDDSLEEVLWTKSSDIESFGGMPVFEIRLISPIGRTPSPIVLSDRSEEIEVQTISTKSALHTFCAENDLVPLQHIDSQISAPSDPPSRTGITSLETIFEDVFLNTPPRRNKHVTKFMGRGKDNSPLSDETVTGRSPTLSPSAQDLVRLRAFKYKSVEMLCSQANCSELDNIN